jgi:hypothetical protein
MLIMDTIEAIQLQSGDILHFTGLTKTDVGSYAIYMHNDDSLLMVDKSKRTVDDMARSLSIAHGLQIVTDMSNVFHIGGTRA